MRALLGVEFLASEYSTGKRHSRRIDTPGIDGAGRSAVIEYKRRRDENVINQGLDYVAWMEDHPAEFRELARQERGAGRVTPIDFGAPRLACVAGEFPRQDRSAAENSHRRVELLRYRRFADTYSAEEWMHGGETIDPAPEPGGPPRRAAGEERASVAPHRPGPIAPGAGEDPDYSVGPESVKASEETWILLRALKTLAEQLGWVRTDPVKTGISFQCMAAAGNRIQVIAHVHLRVRSGLRAVIHERLVRDVPLEDGFTRPSFGGLYREIDIRDTEQVRRAEPLLRAAYDRLSRSTAWIES